MCIAFLNKQTAAKPCIMWSGEKLKWVDKVKHLGNIISSGMDESEEIKLKKKGNSWLEQTQWLLI